PIRSSSERVANSAPHLSGCCVLLIRRIEQPNYVLRSARVALASSALLAVSAKPSQAPRPVLHALLVVPFAPASLRGNATRGSSVHDAVLYGFELLWLIRRG